MLDTVYPYINASLVDDVNDTLYVNVMQSTYIPVKIIRIYQSPILNYCTY